MYALTFAYTETKKFIGKIPIYYTLIGHQMETSLVLINRHQMETSLVLIKAASEYVRVSNVFRKQKKHVTLKISKRIYRI